MLDGHVCCIVLHQVLDGVEVLKETCIQVGQSSQHFKWEGFGFKLTVPPNALPFTFTRCTFTIQASLSGQYQFPANTELVSPVFWLRCEPQCKFNKPISLQIQHCAPPENAHRLFMVKALCTQTDLPYFFRVIHGANFSQHSSYGTIALEWAWSRSGLTSAGTGQTCSTWARHKTGRHTSQSHGMTMLTSQ